MTQSRRGAPPLRRVWAPLTFIALGLSSGSAIAALRANYEVTLTVDGSVHSARSSVPVQSGVAIAHEFKPVDVRLVPRLNENGGYELAVELGSKARTPEAIATLATRSFRGSLGIPLEFEANFDGLVVSGAIMLHGTLD